MKSKVRALARYWFIAPLLFAVVGLQMGLGFVTGDEQGANSARLAASPTLTRRPTFTVTPLPTSSPTSTFTPSPTRTPTPTETPTGTLSPTATPLPSATPTSTHTPTPQPTPTAKGFALQVPILMYHYLSVPPAGANVIRQDLSVTPDLFEAHLAYLRQAGYETISLEELSYALSQEATLPPKPIIITFDDGYRDHYENAFPLLRKYDYTATFFVFTQPIDENNVDYLSWDMVKEMHQAGMEFGSHSYRHSDLSGRDVDFLVYEILGSKEAIEERIGEPVRFFCYPSGRYDGLTIKVLESANFWGAVTTQWGVEQSFNSRFELKRLRMRGNDTAETLAAKLALF
ncbi:MAG: hypothetical protein Fur0044_18290 [Anaerolineae bacterium]